MSDRNCARCWHSRDVDPWNVECHRRAPALVDNDNRAVWPVLDVSDSCSEWEPMPANELPEAGDPGPDLLLQMLQMQSGARDPEQPPMPPWRWAPSDPVASPSEPPARPAEVVTFDDTPDPNP